MITLPILHNQEHAYDIVLDEGDLFENLDLSSFQNRKALVVTDHNVQILYSAILKKRIASVFSEIHDISFVPGELSKNLEQIHSVYACLCDAHFDRHDLIIALGGGVVGDMAGFAAATFMRGIRFIQIPTTLLSQTDSSIGGKTGVDFKGYKNIIGAFYMPSLVYIHPGFLRTLPDRQFFCGMGEIIKHALIRDNDYAKFLLENHADITKKEIVAVNKMIARSCEIKGKVVERDPKEMGERATLNFGHTIGHAIEKEMQFSLLHGECVALGVIAASYISMRRNMISLDDLDYIEQLFRTYNLPVRLQTQCLPMNILDHIKSDKKMNNKQIRYVLLDSIGHAVLDDTVKDEEILDAVSYIQESPAPR